MKKNFIKISLSCFISLCIFLMGNIYASSIAVSGASSASPGNTVNVSVGGSFTGRVNVTVSNGSGNKSIWVENNTVTVPVTVGSSGTTTITAVSEAGTSDANGNVSANICKKQVNNGLGEGFIVRGGKYFFECCQFFS